MGNAELSLDEEDEDGKGDGGKGTAAAGGTVGDGRRLTSGLSTEGVDEGEKLKFDGRLSELRSESSRRAGSSGGISMVSFGA